MVDRADLRSVMLQLVNSSLPLLACLLACCHATCPAENLASLLSVRVELLAV